MLVEGLDCNQQPHLESLGLMTAIKGYIQLPLDVLIPDSIPEKCKNAC